MTFSDLEWLSEIFNDTKHHAISLRQLSFLSNSSVVLVYFLIFKRQTESFRSRYCHVRNVAIVLLTCVCSLLNARFVPGACNLSGRLLNPLDCRGNYIATSHNMKLLHWSLMGGLLHLVQRGRDWAGPQPAQAPSRCIKCNSPPINGQCTNHRIAVQRSVALRF